jgi:hypothetical protein
MIPMPGGCESNCAMDDLEDFDTSSLRIGTMLPSRQVDADKSTRGLLVWLVKHSGVATR